VFIIVANIVRVQNTPNKYMGTWSEENELVGIRWHVKITQSLRGMNTLVDRIPTSRTRPRKVVWATELTEANTQSNSFARTWDSTSAPIRKKCAFSYHFRLLRNNVHHPCWLQLWRYLLSYTTKHAPTTLRQCSLTTTLLMRPISDWSQPSSLRLHRCTYTTFPFTCILQCAPSNPLQTNSWDKD
jgi:hypothetical protein